MSSTCITFPCATEFLKYSARRKTQLKQLIFCDHSTVCLTMGIHFDVLLNIGERTKNNWAKTLYGIPSWRHGETINLSTCVDIASMKNCSVMLFGRVLVMLSAYENYNFRNWLISLWWGYGDGYFWDYANVCSCWNLQVQCIRYQVTAWLKCRFFWFLILFRLWQRIRLT